MARVLVSSVIDAPVEAVWDRIRRFDSVAEWLPFVVSSPMEDGGDPTEVGAIRTVTQDDGGVFREIMVAHSDADQSYSYTFVGSPIPVRGHETTLRLRKITDGNRTLGEWTSRFEGKPDQEAELAALIETNFLAGLKALNSQFRSG